jgi:hypothetical protein
MPQDDERATRLKQQRSKEAIDLAMRGQWREAVVINKEIIEISSDDIEACNRLGRAYMELGDYNQARAAYSRTVELDPYNAIAKRNLRRLNELGEQDDSEVETDAVEPHQFIEEIGKAGVVGLYDLAPKEKRARMVAGDRVYLNVEGPGLTVTDSRGEYLGKVDSRPGQRLARLMLGGNQYQAAVVASTVDMMTVMIRETYQAPAQAGKLSFPPKGLEEVRPYVSDRILKSDAEDEEDSGYTIIGGDEIEVLPEESDDSDDDAGGDEE